MFSPFSTISDSVADTLSFTSDNIASTFVDVALIAAIALAVFGPTPKTTAVYEERFVQKSSFSSQTAEPSIGTPSQD